MCWFQGGVTRSSGPPEPLAGLGLLEGSLTVHADGEPERLPVWLASVRDGTLPGGWALDDGVGLLFRGLRMDRVVSSRPGAGAQRVDQVAGELVRHRLTPELLGDGQQPRSAASTRRCRSFAACTACGAASQTAAVELGRGAPAARLGARASRSADGGAGRDAAVLDADAVVRAVLVDRHGATSNSRAPAVKPSDRSSCAGA